MLLNYVLWTKKIKKKCSQVFLVLMRHQCCSCGYFYNQEMNQTMDTFYFAFRIYNLKMNCSKMNYHYFKTCQEIPGIEKKSEAGKYQGVEK